MGKQHFKKHCLNGNGGPLLLTQTVRALFRLTDEYTRGRDWVVANLDFSKVGG
jgi:hypothetical protein